MLVGAAALIEMVYHLQLNAALGPRAAASSASTLDAAGVDSWFGARRRCWSPASALFELARRQLRARQWGEIQEEIEDEIKRREAL